MTNNWIEEENARAEELAKTGTTTNQHAPLMIKKAKRSIPSRSVRTIYLQEQHSRALDKLAFEQKMCKGKKTPELIEEAIELLLIKYGAKL